MYMYCTCVQEDVYRSAVTYGLLQTVLHRYHANNTLLTAAWDSIQQQVRTGFSSSVFENFYNFSQMTFIGM